MAQNKQKTYIVEHLDPELGPWSALEYKTIAQECLQDEAKFVLSHVSPGLKPDSALQNIANLQIEARPTEELYAQDERPRICLLDPAAEKDLEPQDREKFDVYLFGGILGDDPPRDRTSELRHKGYARRRLGPVQMTTDTAVRVTRMVVQGGKPLDSIPYVDFPELKINEHESTGMPFRYVKGDEGRPVMPNGMVDLIKKDSEKGFGELF